MSFGFGSCTRQEQHCGPFHIFLLHLLCCGILVSSCPNSLRDCGALRRVASPGESALKFPCKVPWTEKTLELPRNSKEITPHPGLGAWGSSHPRSQAQDPKLGLRDMGRQDSAQGKRSACIWAEAEKVPNNNSFNPSMKKETHCVYRYRAWPQKHESTFGSGAPGQGCWTAAPLLRVVRPTRFLFPQPDLRGGQVHRSQVFLPRPSPVSLLGSDLGRTHGEKVLGPPSCHKEGNCFSLQSTET